MTPGYESLTTGAAFIDLSRRGRIRVTGEDRTRLLHAMTTNHVQQMKPGDGIYVFFLNAQGRILADALVLCFEDHFLLDTAPETRRPLYEHLDHYIIADDVTLADVTEQTFSFGLEGPKAIDVAARCGMQAPHHRFSHVASGELVAANIAATGSHGIRIYGAIERREEVIALIEGAGAIAASEEDAETVRIENFVPRYGCDITEHTLPQETQQMHALHFPERLLSGAGDRGTHPVARTCQPAADGFSHRRNHKASRARNQTDAGRAGCGRGDFCRRNPRCGIRSRLYTHAVGEIRSHG